MALVTCDVGGITAVLRAIGANCEVAADRLPVGLVLVECWAAGFDRATAMSLGITAAADHLGLHPAGRWGGHRRGSDRLCGWDQTREQGEHHGKCTKKALHGVGVPSYWIKTTAEAISQDACGGKTAMPIRVATL